jgi:hypothetical protein
MGQPYCAACGQYFSYNCPYCRAQVDNRYAFCPSCNGQLPWPSAGGAQYTQPTQYTQPGQYAQPPQYAGESYQQDPRYAGGQYQQGQQQAPGQYTPGQQYAQEQYPQGQQQPPVQYQQGQGNYPGRYQQQYPPQRTPAGQGERRNPLIIGILAVLLVVIISVGGYFTWNALSKPGTSFPGFTSHTTDNTFDNQFPPKRATP